MATLKDFRKEVRAIVKLAIKQAKKEHATMWVYSDYDNQLGCTFHADWAQEGWCFATVFPNGNIVKGFTE